VSADYCTYISPAAPVPTMMISIKRLPVFKIAPSQTIVLLIPLKNVKILSLFYVKFLSLTKISACFLVRENRAEAGAT
jgi:hypothetical protein